MCNYYYYYMCIIIIIIICEGIYMSSCAVIEEIFWELGLSTIGPKDRTQVR